MMAGGTTERLGQQLRSEDDRMEALQAISAIEPVSEEAVTALTDDLATTLATETNAYTILQLLKQLRRFAESHPAETAPALEPVTRLVSGTLEGFQGDDPAENRRIALGSRILEAIIESTEPEDIVLVMEYQEISPVIEHGNPEHRALGYRLLGRTATGEAVRVLLQDFSHEMDQVVDACREGLLEARELAGLSLSGDGPVRRLHAIDAFAELYAAGEVEPSEAQLETIHRGIFEMSRTYGDGDREALLATVETLCKSDVHLAESVVEEAIDILRAAPDRKREMWQLLGAVAGPRPTIVLERADTLTHELSPDDPSPLETALGTIRTAAEGASSVPVSLATRVLELTGHDDEGIALSAVEAVGAMGFYPVPEQIEELVEGGSARLSRRAADARDRLRDGADRTPRFVRSLGRGDKTVSLFAGQTGDVHLKRRTEGGLWRDVDIGELDEGIVQAVVDRLDRDENVPVVYPHYSPRELVTLAIAVTLAAPEQNRQVGIYSPGSRNHWGNKGEIRSLLREFGLSDTSGTVIKATPLPDVVTEAYVGNDGLTDNSDGTGPGRMVLSKRISELTEVPSLDVAIVNSISRTKLDLQEEVSDMEDAHPDATIVSAYSYYTENETKGRPRYGPPFGLESVLTIPGADIIDQVLTNPPASNEGGRRHRGLREGADEDRDEGWYMAGENLKALARPATVEIDHVDSGELEQLLDSIFDHSASLFEVDDAGAGGLIFSRQMFFERLPIPPEAFDDWVRARYEEGDRFVPPLIRERIGDVERKAGTVENLQAVQPLNKAEALLNKLRDQLQRRNPLYERLEEHLTQAKDEGQRLAIFRAGVEQARMLEDVLVEHGLVSQEDLEDGPISVMSPNDARKMEPHDRLLVFGTLHPENAGFYVHPRVERTVVVTYNRLWVDSIGRHAKEYVDLLNATVGDSGYEPFPEPEIVGDIHIDEEKAEATEEVPVETGPAAGKGSSPSRKTRAQIIADAMESASTAGYGEEAGRYHQEVRYYLLETDEGERYVRTSENRILRQRTTSDESELHWTGPASLSEGDTVVAIPDDVREELWRAHLDEVYDDEGTDADVALENLQTWYDTLNQIWDTVQEEFGDTETISEGEIYRRLHGWLDSEVDHFSRTPGTVRSWFQSVREADRPMHLVQNPSLVIGPRSYKDIEAIGLAFGYDDLATDAETIEGAMEGLRTMNRREGHRYRESLREKVAASGQTRAAEAATYHTLTKISEADSPSAFESDPEASVSELPAEEIVDRVQELVELAPTKNSELVDEWGFEDGSELYGFMTSELDAYFERNEEGLIVPTDAARSLINEET